MNHFQHLAVAAMCLLISCAVIASDVGKEKRWADQIVDSLMDGEAVYLKAGDHEFLTLHTEAEEGEGAQAAIVIHGSGVHPNWSTVVYPIRTRMPAKGWQTLSIQMPVLHNEAEYSEYLPLFPNAIPRIEAAIAYLKEKGANKIVILAHSLGSRMAAYALAEKPQPVAGFAAIGMPGRSGKGNDNSIAHIGKIRVPMLDLYGSEDLPEVVKTAAERQKAGGSNPKFNQVMVEKADHFFDGEEDLLMAEIWQWVGGL